MTGRGFGAIRSRSQTNRRSPDVPGPGSARAALRHSRSLAVVTFVASVGVGTLSGCSVGQLRGIDAQRPKPTPIQSALPVPDPVEAREQDALAAIEDFLARTQQYRVPTTAVAAQVPTNGTPPTAARRNPSAVPPDKAVANTQVTIADPLPPKPELAIPALQALVIRGSEPPPTVGPTTPVKTNITNAPLDVHPTDAPLTLERLEKHLQTQLDARKDFSTEWQLRLVQLALDRDADAAKESAYLPVEAQRLLGALVPVIVAVRNMARNAMVTSDEALTRVDLLREALTERADPTVRTVALCRKVVTFGTYEEMTPEDLVAGRTLQTIVYSEIAHLRSERIADGRYQTRLGTRLEVLTADGKSLWQREEPEIVDVCRRRRVDFFIAQRITLPPTLATGDYVLKVLVEDKLSGTAGEAAHPFTIHAPIAVAKGR